MFSSAATCLAGCSSHYTMPIRTLRDILLDTHQFYRARTWQIRPGRENIQQVQRALPDIFPAASSVACFVATTCVNFIILNEHSFSQVPAGAGAS